MTILKKYLFFFLIVFFAFQTSLFASDKIQFDTTPKTNNGQKWRIGYYEGGEYPDYQESLKATIKGLMRLGWIEKNPIPFKSEQKTIQLWRWLSEKTKSDYIHFVKNAYYSAGWDESVRGSMAEEIIQRLNQKKDLDLMIAMGTWAGQDLTNDRHTTPTVAMSTSDPLNAGIIKHAVYSGYDNVFVRFDPNRYERQLRMFHDIVGFKRLGVAYENTIAGRSYAAIDAIEKVSKERRFEIARCFTLSDIPDQKLAEETVKKCFRELAEKTDAIYITVQGGVNSSSLFELVEIANARRVPTFSQSGSKEVEYGVLLSVSREAFDPVGQYYAEILAKIFNGAKPGQLNQVFEDSPHVAINLKTAGIIGFYLRADLLSAADEVYREIKIPE